MDRYELKMDHDGLYDIFDTEKQETICFFYAEAKELNEKLSKQIVTDLNNPWIPMESGLRPGHEEFVLVWDESAANWFEAQYLKSDPECWAFEKISSKERLTHWRRIPKPI